MTPTTTDFAIVQTLAYADVFNFPMSVAEIHHFLIGHLAALSEIQTALTHPSDWLCQYIQSQLIEGQPFYALQTANSTIFEQRQRHQQASWQLWPKAIRYGKWLGYLPFVRMVAMTGALSVHNASSLDDDLDYILVVKTRRVWLARLFAVAMVRVVRVWGVTLCPNYVLATEAMPLPKADLFLAHEISQMTPLVGHAVYYEMRALNTWSIDFLPNAIAPFFPTVEAAPHGVAAATKAACEWLLGGFIGDRLEAWEMRRKLRKLGMHLQANDEVKLDEQQVKGHFMSYGQLTLQRYHDRLVHLDLMPHPLDQSSAAD